VQNCLVISFTKMTLVTTCCGLWDLRAGSRNIAVISMVRSLKENCLSNPYCIYLIIIIIIVIKITELQICELQSYCFMCISWFSFTNRVKFLNLFSIEISNPLHLPILVKPSVGPGSSRYIMVWSDVILCKKINCR